MFGEKRSGVEILQDILRSAAQGHRKTRIMYGANLSYEMLVKYLEFLTTKGFVVLDDETGKFSVTPRGYELLRDLDRVTRHFRDEPVALATTTP